jgi:NADP-dependent aldehyde dehydrogenase
VTTIDELPAITAAAGRAAHHTAAASDAERAGWLRAIADRLDAATDELVGIADTETHLGSARLTGEVARTSGQLRLFAEVVEEGSYLEATIDHARPEAVPPRPELRRMLIPVGVVGVFSASNFPFAFSVAGGDTASALAVGCPVIVKAHSGHRRLSERTAELVAAALAEAGAPEGTFALVAGREVGSALVLAPEVRAIGFTGSLAGGRALFDLAASRPDPIPFYGELGSINPVVVTSAAVRSRGAELAAGLAASFTLGAGQFCTKPGVVFVPEGAGFEAELVSALGSREAAPMLTVRISDAFPAGLAAVASHPAVELIAGDLTQDAAASGATPVILATTTEAVRSRPDALLEEVFGPVTLLVRYRSRAELLDAIEHIPGSLTATLHAEPDEHTADLVGLLRDRAGRLLFRGWPTGVAVTWSQQHGGPWPATTSQHTSVGATATRRFLRPIAYQDAPESALPEVLRDANPRGIPRRIDGVLTV